MKKRILKSFVFALLLLMIPVGVFAEETTVSTTTVPEVQGAETDNTDPFTGLDKDNPANIQVATMDQLEDNVETKAKDVIGLLKTVGFYICLVIFIVCIIIAVLGAVSKKGFGRGILGMCISGVMGVCCIYSEQIYNFFRSWIAK